MVQRAAILLIVVLAAVGGGLAIWYPQWLGVAEAPLPAEQAPPKVFHPRATGRIEPAGGVIEVSGPVGDRVVWIDERLKPASQGRDAAGKLPQPLSVSEGEVLARTESYELKTLEIEGLQSQIKEASARLTAEIAAAGARVETAKAELKIAEGSAADIAIQEEKIGIAQGNLRLAELGQQGLKKLAAVDDELVNEAEMQRQQLLVDQASAQVKAEKSVLNKLKSATFNTIESAKAALEAAKAQLHVVEASSSIVTLNKRLELAQRQRTLGEIRAPRDGVILKVHVQEGETIGRLPVCLMASVDTMVVVAEVNETEVQHIDLDRPVMITSPAFGRENEVMGRIRSRDWIVAESALASPGAFAASDRRVIEYRIQVDDDDAPLVRDFINLGVDVVFNQDPSLIDDPPAPQSAAH